MNEEIKQEIEKKIESEKEVRNQQQTVKKDIPLPKSIKNPKQTKILLIILFFFFFTFVMLIPTIRDYVQQEQYKKDMDQVKEEIEQAEKNPITPTPVPTEDTKELTCTSISMTIDNYTMIQIQKFHYNEKNQILRSSITQNYTFTSLDEFYDSLKNQCSDEKYLTYKGYTISCDIEGNNITLMNEFDLSTFRTINDSENGVYIEANTTYKQDLNSVKSTLTTQGYTCSEE